MMSLKEIVGSELSPAELRPEKLAQCQDLTNKVNIIRAAWGKAMTVNSGVRTWKHHVEIYKSLAVQKRYPFNDGVFNEDKVPKLSKHLENVLGSAAVDIADPNQILKAWLKDTAEGQAALNKANLWCEDDNVQRLHFQNKAFGSYKPGGTRWFKP